MRLIRYRSYDGVAWGTVDGGMVKRLTSMTGRPEGTETPIEEVTLLPPCEPNVIVCVGRNYADHIREMGNMPLGGDLPTEPGLFLKGLNTLSGSGDDIPYPTWTQDLQYEGELAVVIGQNMRNVSVENALDHVLGYTCAVDVTARDKQRSDLQWVRGKSADGFCPVGPWLETDIDPANVGVRTVVNGQVRQDGHTRDMIFPVAQVLAYISSFMTLSPGDLVLTGTPEGVGRLEVGDTIEVSVEGIGTLVNQVAAEDDALPPVGDAGAEEGGW
ncbi:MAG TPA: fumarylacetoacetate hydrolase family protein [Trueperaceae bacterium]